MQWTASRFVVSLGLLAVAACADDSPTEPSPLTIEGPWSYVETYNSTDSGLSCEDEGTVTIEQEGASFSGSFEEEGACTYAEGGTSESSGWGTVDGGQLSGSDVSFVSGGCTYEGTLSGTPPNRMTGDMSCQKEVDGTTYSFTGTWTAER